MQCVLVDVKNVIVSALPAVSNNADKKIHRNPGQGHVIMLVYVRYVSCYIALCFHCSSFRYLYIFKGNGIKLLSLLN
jgi:hypothetical protein